MSSPNEGDYWVKLHPSGRDVILAVCDEELLEGTFSDGELSITVYRDFYGGVRVDEQGLKQHLINATILNLVGERCIEVAIREGWVEKENTLRIGEVLHAQAAIIFDDQAGKG